MAKSLHSFSPATQDSLKHGLQSVREAIKALEQAVGNDTTAPRPQGLRAADEATHALRVLGDDLAHKLGIDLWTADLSTVGKRDGNNGGKTSPDRDGNNGGKTSPDRDGNNGGKTSPDRDGNNGGKTSPDRDGNNGGKTSPDRGA